MIFSDNPSTSRAMHKASFELDVTGGTRDTRLYDNYVPYTPAPPCDECKQFSLCAADGRECLAFKQYVEEAQTGNKWLKSNMGVFKWA